MATNYTELKTEVQDWLDNDNPNLIAAIPSFISDAENRLSRLLRTWEMECYVPTDLVPAGATEDDVGTYDLPADWAGHRFVEIRPDEVNGDKLWIMYYFRIPPLSDANITNWLLDKHPDLYRLMSLLSAEAWLKNDPRIEVWRAAAGSAIEEINLSDETDRYSGGPHVSRVLSQRPWRRFSRTYKRLDYLTPYEWHELEGSGLQRYHGPRDGFFTVSAQKIRIWPVPALPTP